MRPARLTIHPSALTHNLARVRELAPRSRIMAMVKANAYGHGLLQAATAFSNSDALGVACLEEAMLLRDAGIRKPIVLMEGFFDQAELTTIIEHDLIPVIHCKEQVALLQHSTLKSRLPIWLKVNTGMHRLGFAIEEFSTAWSGIHDLPVECRGIMTHFAHAFDVNSMRTQAQIECFEQAVQGLPGERSLANSAGILAWPQSHANWVRPGIMLYGASPFEHDVATDHGIQASHSLTSSLIAVQTCKAGDAVSYGGTWICPETMRVGIVAMGYGDGYPRQAVNGTPVIVNQQRVPLIGRVCMDMLCVDLRSQPEARVGDPVELWGRQLPIDEVARSAGTIAYELLTRITSRVQRLVD